MQIALVADPHITRGTEEDQALYKGRFAKAIQAINAAKVDVCLIAGDLTQGIKAEQVSDFLEMTKAITAPSYWIPGNHDTGDKLTPGKTQLLVSSEKALRYEALLGPACQAIEVAGVRVVMANSSLYGSGLPEEAAQWEFLERELGRQSDTPTILLQHYPLFITHPDEPGGTYWALEPEPRHRLLDLLQRGRVLAVLAGHYHRPVVTYYNGMANIIAPAVSFGIPRETQCVGWARVTIMAPPTGANSATGVLAPTITTRFLSIGN